MIADYICIDEMTTYQFGIHLFSYLKQVSFNNITMNVLPRQFSSLSYCGLWEEKSVKLTFKKTFYRAFTISLIFYLNLAGIIYFVITYESFEDIVEIYHPILFSVFTFQVMNFLLRKNFLRTILINFEDNSFKSRSPEETAILSKYLKKSQQIFMFIMIMVETCTFSMSLSPLFELKEGIRLPLNIYTPYDVSQPTLFIITYIFQFLLISLEVFINIALDTIVYGLMLLTMGQFELCAYRIENSSQDEKTISSETIKKCIEHHVRILNLVKQIESLFMIGVSPFIVFSLLILCTTIFQIIQVLKLNKEFLLFTKSEIEISKY